MHTHAHIHMHTLIKMDESHQRTNAEGQKDEIGELKHPFL